MDIETGCTCVEGGNTYLHDRSFPVLCLAVFAPDAPCILGGHTPIPGVARHRTPRETGWLAEWQRAGLVGLCWSCGAGLLPAVNPARPVRIGTGGSHEGARSCPLLLSGERWLTRSRPFTVVYRHSTRRLSDRTRGHPFLRRLPGMAPLVGPADFSIPASSSYAYTRSPCHWPSRCQRT